MLEEIVSFAFLVGNSALISQTKLDQLFGVVSQCFTFLHVKLSQVGSYM